MGLYENSIKGVSSFVAGSNAVTNDEWVQYVTNISVVDQLSGVNGVGIIYPQMEGLINKSYIYPDTLNFKNNFGNLVNHPEIYGLLQLSMIRNKPILSPP